MLVFLLIFLIVFVFGLLLFKIRFPKYNSRKMSKQLQIIKKKYNIDMANVNYDDIIIMLSFFDALVISIIAIIAFSIKSLILKFIVSFFLMVLLLLGSYTIIGNIYKTKKRRKRNES